MGVDLMSDPFRPYIRKQRVAEILVGSLAAPQQLPHVRLVNRKQAVAQLAVGRQPDAIAIHAERLADRCHKANARAGIGEAILRCRSPRIGIGNRLERCDFALQHGDHLVGQEDFRLVPEPLGVQRHELDIADFVAIFAPEPGHRHHVRLDQIGHRDDIDLDRSEAHFLRVSEPVQHLAEIVAAGDFEEALTVERVEVDIQPPQPGAVQVARLLFQQDRVGGERDILNTWDRHQLRDQIRQAFTQEWLATGQPQLADTHARGDAHKAGDFLEGQNLLARTELDILGHAVEAADIAAVGDADPQVIVESSEGINKGSGG